VAVLIPLEKLNPHPDNPRLVTRQDVVDGIVAQIEREGGFDPAHVLIVRPFDGAFRSCPAITARSRPRRPGWRTSRAGCGRRPIAKPTWRSRSRTPRAS
jgi:hypothetical protein